MHIPFSGRPFSPNAFLNKATCNVIALLIYAHRFEYEDLRLNQLLRLLEDTMKEESGIVPQVLGRGPPEVGPLRRIHMQGQWAEGIAGQATTGGKGWRWQMADDSHETGRLSSVFQIRRSQHLQSTLGVTQA